MSVLGSGSAGNSTLVAAGRARVLLDAGFSCRELTRRLAQVGESPERLDGVLLSHEHTDHTKVQKISSQFIQVLDPPA